MSHNDRRYASDKEDYSPKFKVGQVVVVTSFLRETFTATVTSRKVTRRNDRAETYYRFDNGEGAYEYSMEPTTYRRTPGDWADNIASSFDCGRHEGWGLTVEGMKVRFAVKTKKGYGTITADLTPDGDVECIAPHVLLVTLTGDIERGDNHDNLGSAMVALSNHLR